MNNRERFSSRLGFILISAGCAVGLGNVWRFPYITGQYGGAAFVLVYLIFLVLLGLPIMVMEFAVGRASQKSAARSFHVLEPAGTKWHLQGYACMAGNYLLMMFYTTVGGWMAAYIFKTLTGEFKGLDSDGVAAVFNDMLARPGYMTFWMVLVVLLSFLSAVSVCKRCGAYYQGNDELSFPHPAHSVYPQCDTARRFRGTALLSDSRFYQIYRKRRRQHDFRRNGTGVLYPEPRHRCDGDFRQLHR